MTVDDVMGQLEALGDAQRREQNTRTGAPEAQFGVKTGDIRTLAKQLKRNPELAQQLWATGYVEAQMLAILLVKPKDLSAEQLDGWARSSVYFWVADWLNNYIAKKHPNRDALRAKWMGDAEPWAARSGWSLTADAVANGAALDIDALLDRVEAEMSDADPRVQWTMNNTLAAIGIHHPSHRERATAIGETLGVYRDYPVSKGCTSPFAPLWIAEMVRRHEASEAR